MRVRVRYAKTGKLRFISAIDLGRVWERALRKAGLPIAYSEGFSPHPKISFTDALPLGYASTGEYAEFVLVVPTALDAAMRALNASFPDGVTVLHAVEVEDGAPKLAKWLLVSCWDLAYPEADGLAEAVDEVRAAEELLVPRERKGPPIMIDLRPAIHHISNRERYIRIILHHVEPLVRPSEVRLALQRFVPALPEETLITRVAQGAPADEGLIEALSGAFVPPLPLSTRPHAWSGLASSEAGSTEQRQPL